MNGERYEAAWRIEAPTNEEYGVLVRCGPPEHPYWWLLCPATSTLYIDAEKRPEDLLDCNFGMECDHDDIHEAAAGRLAVMLREGSG